MLVFILIIVIIYMESEYSMPIYKYCNQFELLGIYHIEQITNQKVGKASLEFLESADIDYHSFDIVKGEKEMKIKVAKESTFGLFYKMHTKIVKFNYGNCINIGNCFILIEKQNDTIKLTIRNKANKFEKATEYMIESMVTIGKSHESGILTIENDDALLDKHTVLEFFKGYIMVVDKCNLNDYAEYGTWLQFHEATYRSGTVQFRAGKEAYCTLQNSGDIDIEYDTTLKEIQAKSQNESKCSTERLFSLQSKTQKIRDTSIESPAYKYASSITSDSKYAIQKQATEVMPCSQFNYAALHLDSNLKKLLEMVKNYKLNLTEQTCRIALLITKNDLTSASTALTGIYTIDIDSTTKYDEILSMGYDEDDIKLLSLICKNAMDMMEFILAFNILMYNKGK